MNNFLDWSVLTTYASFVTMVFMVVEFTKELAPFNKIPTRYWSFLISFVLMLLTNIALSTFEVKDILLYLLSSISISLGSNGLSDFNTKKKEGE